MKNLIIGLGKSGIAITRKIKLKNPHDFELFFINDRYINRKESLNIFNEKLSRRSSPAFDYDTGFLCYLAYQDKILAKIKPCKEIIIITSFSNTIGSAGIRPLSMWAKKYKKKVIGFFIYPYAFESTQKKLIAWHALESSSKYIDIRYLLDPNQISKNIKEKDFKKNITKTENIISKKISHLLELDIF